MSTLQDIGADIPGEPTAFEKLWPDLYLFPAQREMLYALLDLPTPQWPTAAESLHSQLVVYDRPYTRRWLEELYGPEPEPCRRLAVLGDRVVLTGVPDEPVRI